MDPKWYNRKVQGPINPNFNLFWIIKNMWSSELPSWKTTHSLLIIFGFFNFKLVQVMTAKIRIYCLNEYFHINPSWSTSLSFSKNLDFTLRQSFIFVHDCLHDCLQTSRFSSSTRNLSLCKASEIWSIICIQLYSNGWLPSDNNLVFGKVFPPIVHDHLQIFRPHFFLSSKTFPSKSFDSLSFRSKSLWFIKRFTTNSYGTRSTRFFFTS